MTRELVIGGKKRSLKFGMLTMMLYDEKVKNFGNVSDNVASILMAYAVVYSALMASVQIKGEAADFDYETVTEWVDELFKEDPEIITGLINDLVAMNNQVPKDDKKKVTAKRGKM